MVVSSGIERDEIDKMSRNHVQQNLGWLAADTCPLGMRSPRLRDRAVRASPIVHADHPKTSYKIIIVVIVLLNERNKSIELQSTHNG